MDFCIFTSADNQHREDGRRGNVYWPTVALARQPIHGVQILMVGHLRAQVVHYGNAARRTGSTGVNSTSSRSHAVLQLELRDLKDNRIGR